MTTAPAVEQLVTDPATPPLWHARRVTAGHAGDVTAAAELLQLCGLMPAQLAAESAHLLDITDFDEARAQLRTAQEAPTVTATDTINFDLDLRPASIRNWALKRGMNVSTMGKIPDAIFDAYLVAHGETPRPKPAPKPTPPVVAISTPGVVEVEGQEAATSDAPRPADITVPVTEDAVLAAVAPIKHLPAPAEPEPMPTPIFLTDDVDDLVEAHQLLQDTALRVGTRAARNVIEVMAPALVRETTEQLHDLVRLLNGDTTP